MHTRGIAIGFILLALPGLGSDEGAVTTVKSPHTTAVAAVPDADSDRSADKEPKEPEERLVTTSHSVLIGGAEIRYTVRAGTILLRDDQNKPTASVFHIAYTRDGITNSAARPVTFSFNGGPGAASVWLHMGLLGPRRVLLENDGSPVAPPYQLVDNEESLLDVTDLVFIDPVSTGYSRPVKPEDAKKFHGLREDVDSVGEFIRLYVTRNQRWASPKFVIGESYGTTRAAALSGELAQRHRMNVNGIMLVSTVLNFQTIDFDEGNDLPYVLFLPSYTASAWYHHKLPADLQELPVAGALALSEAFAAGPYHTALLRGAALSTAERRKIIPDLARYTGLTESDLDRADLRVPMSRFAKLLLAGERRVVGRFDSRYTGRIRDPLGSEMEYDPSGEAVMSAYASTFNHYVRTELNYETDLTYEVLTSVQPWNWDRSNGYVNVGRTLAESLTRNPFLKVHVSSGYYDLATPYFATRYTFNHLGVDPELLRNLTLDDYSAGHMMYLNLPDLKKQKSDLSRFIRSASGR